MSNSGNDHIGDAPPDKKTDAPGNETPAAAKDWKNSIFIYDVRRNIAIADTEDEMVALCTEHFVDCAARAIARSGRFAVALSGGSTPKRIFQNITSTKHRHRIDWEKVLLFWSDERAVPPDHPDSNYRMAMEAGFANVPIQATHIFRMCGEREIEANAKRYEQILKEQLSSGMLDLVILGMGDDGHTASLFPNTHALESDGRLVMANYVPEHHCWRMTLSFEAINQSLESVIYIIGKSKAAKVKEVFSLDTEKENLPIDRIGTPQHPALWILDAAAASELPV